MAETTSSHEQQEKVAQLRDELRPERRFERLRAHIQRHRRIGQPVDDIVIGRDLGGLIKLLEPAVDVVVAQRDLEGCFGVAARARSGGHLVLDLGEEFVDKAPLARIVHRLANNAAGSQQCQVGHLRADVGHGALAFGLDVGSRLLA